MDWTQGKALSLIPSTAKLAYISEKKKNIINVKQSDMMIQICNLSIQEAGGAQETQGQFGLHRKLQFSQG